MKKEKTLRQHFKKTFATVISLLALLLILTVALSSSREPTAQSKDVGVTEVTQTQELSETIERVLDPFDVEFVIIKTEVKDYVLVVHRADSPEERRIGLSGVRGLAEDHGMLFVFPEPSMYSFWMKGMNFPVDIIWINGEGEIVYMSEHIEPDTYPSTFSPVVDALYVLEVPAGYVERHTISIGDRVIIEQ